MYRSMSRVVAVVGVAGLALGLAACAGSAVGGGGGGGDEGGPIKIMTIAPVSTTLQSYPDAEFDASAAVTAINEAGGIDGRELSWSFCNTESDPNKATACARKAVTEGVVAVVGQTDAFTTNSLPILEDAGIVTLGLHAVGNEIDSSSPIAFPFSGGAEAAHAALPNAFAQMGDTKTAIVAIEVAASTDQIPRLEQAIEREGLEYAGAVTIPVSGVSDYAPFAQQIEDLGADSVIFATSAGVATAVINASRSLGMDTHFGYNAFSFGEPEFLALGDDAEGLWVASPYPTFHEAEIPAVQQFVDELAAADGDDPVNLRLVGFNAWLGVHAFADIVADMDGDVTAETFREALESAGEIDLMGLLAWDPSTLGADTAYPRFPGVEQRFLTLIDGQLRTDPDLDPAADTLAGIER